MAPRRTRLLSCLLVPLLASLAAPPLRAAGDDFHPERLPWITDVSRTIRHGALNALWQERNRLVRQRNEARKQFTWFYAGEYVELEDGQPVTWATVQRCLGDRMVTERWKYRLERRGSGSWRIAGREKVAEFDGMFRSIQQPPENAHPVRPFEFRHGGLTLEVKEGHAVPVLTNGHMDEFFLRCKGHVKLEPPGFYERQVFRNATGKETLDAELRWIRVIFNSLDEEEWLARLGWTRETLTSPGTGFPDDADNRMIARNNRELAKSAYQPVSYYLPERTDQRGWFYVRFGTSRGVYTYSYHPWWIREVLARRHEKTKTGKDVYRTVLYTHAPETAGLPPAVRDRRRDEYPVRPLRYDAMIEVDRERLDVRLDMDLAVLRTTRFVTLPLGGNAKIHYVRQEDGRDLLVLPLALEERTPRFGKEEVEEWVAVLPRPAQKGEHLHLQVCLSNPDALLTEEEWLVWTRTNWFLPFREYLSGGIPLHCVVRSEAKFRHMGPGNLVAERVVDGMRYTEWDSAGPVPVPLVAVAQWLGPREKMAGDVRVVGYMPLRFYGHKMPVPRAEMIDPYLARVAASLRFFGHLFGVPYHWKELRVLGIPPDLFVLRAPAAGIVLPEYYFWPPVRRERMNLGDPTVTAGTLTHQLAHQWWGGSVDAVSWEHDWILEGLAQLSEAIHDEVARPGEGYRRHLRGWRKVALLADWKTNLLDTAVAYAHSRTDTGVRWYKSPFVLHMLGVYFGRERLRELLQDVAREFDGKAICTADLQALAERRFGTRLDWFFEDWVRNLGHPRVLWKAGEPRRDPAGEGWLVDVTLRQEYLVGKRTVKDRHFRHLLVPVRIDLEEGEPAWRRVVLEDEELTKTFVLPARPKEVRIDPDGSMLFVTKELEEADDGKE